MQIESERGNYETELRIKELCAWTEDESMQQLHQILSPSILDIRCRDSGRDTGASLSCWARLKRPKDTETLGREQSAGARPRSHMCFLLRQRRFFLSPSLPMYQTMGPNAWGCLSLSSFFGIKNSLIIYPFQWVLQRENILRTHTIKDFSSTWDIKQGHKKFSWPSKYLLFFFVFEISVYDDPWFHFFVSHGECEKL